MADCGREVLKETHSQQHAFEFHILTAELHHDPLSGL
jgi:hypothetical protein